MSSVENEFAHEECKQLDVFTEIPTKWRYKRYYSYIAATIFFLMIPWIVIDGNHFFLLSFDNLKLHLAFIEFDMQELYLMPFLLMMLFLGIFGMTVVGGRVFCGWVCPQTVFRTIYRDLIETKILKMRKRIADKQKEPDMTLVKNKIKKAVAILIAVALAGVAGANFLWFFVPPEDFFPYIMDYQNHWTLTISLLVLVVFLVYDIVFLQEKFCAYVCPYSRIQSVLYDEHTVMAIYNTDRGGIIYDENNVKKYSKLKDIKAAQPEAECAVCETCVRVCPTHIDIRKGLQLECINCLECVDACTEVMGKQGKESLVTWSSEYEIVSKKGKTKFFRAKVLGYITVLIVLVGILSVMGSKKEHMLLNINKESRLYSLKKSEDGFSVDNAYEILLQNIQKEPMKYYFEVIPPKDLQGKIYIVQPQQAFTAVPGKRKKKVVILRTNDMLVNSKENTIIPITIRAYAVDKEDEIVVYRRSTFTFPSQDEFEK